MQQRILTKVKAKDAKQQPVQPFQCYSYYLSQFYNNVLYLSFRIVCLRHHLVP